MIGRQVLGTFLLSSMLSAICGCGGANPPMDPVAFQADVRQWREEREARLTQEDGWLSLVALYWLAEGENRFGTAADNELVLPAGSAPEHAGILRYEGGQVTLEPSTDADILIEGAAVTAPTRLANDAEVDPTEFRAGRLRLYVLQRGDTHAIRVKDPESLVRTHFHGLEYFDADPTYRLTARFQPYEEPKDVKIPTVQGTVETMVVPGTVEFRLKGQDFSLQAFADSVEDDELFIILKDGTSGKQTYGLGRYVYAHRTGTSVTLDLNRAYNPPCAFTTFATCPLPPRQNWMDVDVEAGEKIYAKGD